MNNLKISIILLILVLIVLVSGCTEKIEEGKTDREILIVDFGKKITSGKLLQKINNDSILKIDSRVIEELEKELEIRVGVQLIDNIEIDTNISLYGKKDYDEKNKIRSRYYTKFSNSVLANFSESDFKVRHIFQLDPSFSGYLTKSGLEKLKKDYRVTIIAKVERTQATI